MFGCVVVFTSPLSWLDNGIKDSIIIIFLKGGSVIKCCRSESKEAKEINSYRPFPSYACDYCLSINHTSLAGNTLPCLLRRPPPLPEYLG